MGSWNNVVSGVVRGKSVNRWRMVFVSFIRKFKFVDGKDQVVVGGFEV